MIKKVWSVQFTRFIAVGLFNTALDFTILNILVFVSGLNPIIANIISVCIGVSISYFLNHYVVFKKQEQPRFGSFATFFFITGLSVVLVQTVVIATMNPVYTHLADVFLNDKSVSVQIKVGLNLAKATAVLIGLFWNYFLYSKFVFSERD